MSTWLGKPSRVVSQPFVGENPSDPSANPVDVFRNSSNHVDAACSILHHAGKSCGFEPCEDSGYDPYTSFLEKVASFPGFISIHRSTSRTYSAGPDVGVLARNAVDAYDVLFVKDDQITASIDRMAATVHGSGPSESYVAVFTQISVNWPESGSITVGIFSTLLQMTANAKEKITCAEQNYQVERTVYQLLPAVLLANAETFAGAIPQCTGQQWMDTYSSPG